MKIQSSASLNNSERDGLSEVLGYITKVYGDDVDFEKYDVVRNALSGDELKRLEDLLIYTIDDREYCKTVNKRILKDDLPLLNKVYEVLDDNDLFKNNRGDYDWDAMEAFEKLCLTSSKGSSGIIKSNNSVNDYVNAQRTIVNIIKKYNRENRDYEYTQRVKNNGGDVSGMFPMNVKPDDFTKNGDYLDAVSVIENFTGKPFDLEEFKRKNASSINSSKVKTIKSDIDWEAVKHGFDDKKYLIYKTGIDGEWEEFPFYGTDDFSVAHVYKGKGYKVEKNENINSSRRNVKEKIMNRRNMKRMVKSGYSNNPDYFGDWFGKGQIDFDAIINPEDEGDLWMVKLWSGSGYVLDVYLCKANDLYEAMNIVFEWSYENEGHNEMIFDYNYVYDEACDAYDEYVEHPDWFSYGDNLSKEDFVDRYVEDNYVGDENELYARDENFFVDKVPDEVLAENRGSVQNSRKSKKGESVESSRRPIKSIKTPLPMYNVYLIAWQEPDTLIEQLKQVKDKLSIKTIAKYPNNEILVQIDPTADVLGIKKELENMADVVLADYAHVTIKPEYVVSSLIRSARDDRVEDYISKRGIKSSRKSIKSSVDSSTIADILKARKEVKEVEDRGDEVIAYLHKDYRDVDADRLADEVLGTIETKYDDFTWDYSPAWMDYSGDEYDDTYAVIIEKKEIESACHGKKKNKKKGESVKSNRKQIKSGKFIKSGAGAGYDVTIEGIELDTQNYKVISDEIDEKWNEHTTVVEFPIKPCVVDKWSAEDYDYGVSSEGLYVDGELVQEYFDDDKRVEGGKATLLFTWYPYTGDENNYYRNNNEFTDVEEMISTFAPRDISIKIMFGGGWFHVYLPNDEIHFEDEYHGYPIDAGEPYDYETMSVDLICPNISENINWYFKHDHELEDIFFGEGEENDDELFNSIERNQKNLNKIFR